MFCDCCLFWNFTALKPNACFDVLEPLVQNLDPGNLCSLVSQYVLPVSLFVTDGSNLLFAVFRYSLQTPTFHNIAPLLASPVPN
jgi:hypothetical protein